MTIQKGTESIRSLDDWKRLAPPKDPEKQWKAGRSAMECAIAWLESPGRLPPEIAALIAGHPDFGQLTVERIEPEALIAFDTRSGPRNSDVAVRASDDHGAVAITVEAKADESFDQPLADVMASALERLLANPASGALERAVELAHALLGPRGKAQPPLGALRYQLFTGVAGTLAMAQAAGASRAIFIVHELVTSATSRAKLDANAADYAAFVRRITNDAGLEVQAGTLNGPMVVPGKPLFESPAALYIGKAVRTIGDPSP